MRARRSSFEWPRPIFIQMTTWINGAFVFWALHGRVLWCLPVPSLRENGEVAHAGSRPSRALRVWGGGLGSLQPIRVRVASQNRV